MSISFSRILPILGFLLGSAYTQDTATSIVRRDAPIPGNYSGALRPQVHFSPPQHFMNDPNGLHVDANGTWHLYYQYNPFDVVAGNQHWGHATSDDLYHWVNQPIAISPPDNNTQVFSGSAVVDVNNTSGFFPNQTNGVVAIYTLNQISPALQTQAISYSYDGGYTFQPYEGNPIIPSTSAQFRDPKVIWYEDHWVAVIAYAQDFSIGLFTSPNLKDWTATSNFSHAGLLGLQYECPNLVEVPVEGTNETMYLLTISINPGAPLGGSITEYFPGVFNGTHFEAVDGAARIADFAKDNYAGQFFYGTPAGEDAISIAWASNWQYTQVLPTAVEGWRSVMSLPRRNYLANLTRLGYDLISVPYDLSPVVGAQLGTGDALANASSTVDYSTVSSNAIYWEVNVTGLPPASQVPAAASFNFSLSTQASGESVSGGFFFGGDSAFWLDRGHTNGFENPFFTDKFSVTQVLDQDGTWSTSGVVDRSIIEVFVDRGRYSGTAAFFPTSPLDLFTLRTDGMPEGVQVSFAVYALNSVWE
ncbi:glycoside hydrolase family 32 protein [Peniophora sp. CONT]|nr:glycoside hydrolase family 32 protein [Peniophora sp. CONT]